MRRFSPTWKACSTMLFTGANPVAPATKMIGFVLSSRRKNEPSGPSNRTTSPTFIAVKTCVVYLPPGIRRMCSSIELAHVRRGREREAALVAVGQQDVDVLAGVEPRHFRALDLQQHPHHVVRQRVQPRHARGVGLHRDVAERPDRHVLDLDVRERRRAAGEHLARGALGRGQERLLIDAIVDGPLQQRGLALAAAAAAAVVRHEHAFAERRVEQLLAVADRHDPVVRVDQHVERFLAHALRRQPRREQEERASRRRRDTRPRPASSGRAARTPAGRTSRARAW